MGTDVAVREQPQDLVARVAAGALTEAENVLVHRLVRLRPGQPGPSREELALMVGEAQHLGLDPFAGQVYFLKLGDAWEAYPHWSGLVKIAEDTGEYLGHDGPFYSEDGKTWTEAWAPAAPPPLCKVVVHRKGHRPTTAVVKYARVNRGSPIWKSDPEGMLGKSALRLALRRAFPKEADRPISAAQLKALQTLASLKGLRDRELRLAEASVIVGREVPSFTDLSKAEATEVYETWAPEVDALNESATAGEAAAGPEDSTAEEVVVTEEAEGDWQPTSAAEPEAKKSEGRERSGRGEVAAETPAPPAPQEDDTLETLMRELEDVRTRRSKVSVDAWLRSFLEQEKLIGIEHADEEQAARGLSWLRTQFGKQH
jgi:hypothetical protein